MQISSELWNNVLSAIPDCLNTLLEETPMENVFQDSRNQINEKRQVSHVKNQKYFVFYSSLEVTTQSNSSWRFKVGNRFYPCCVNITS